MIKDPKSGKKVIKKIVPTIIEPPKKPESPPSLFQPDGSNLLKEEEIMKIDLEGEV